MSNCSQLSVSDYIIASSLRATAAGLSFFSSLATLTVIVIFKKYHFMSQRIILYLCIAVGLSSLARTINIAPRTYNPDNEQVADVFCSIAGFLDQYTFCSVIFAVTSITIDVFIVAVFDLKTKYLEPVYFIAIFFLPLAFNWVPFINSAYGDAGAWCWIRAEKDCSTFLFGVVLQFTLLYIPILLIMLLLFLLLLVTLCILYIHRYKYDDRFDVNRFHNRRMIRKEIKQLIWYPIIFIAINIIPAIHRLYAVNRQDDPVLLCISAFIAPLQGVFITLAFVLDPETRKRLTWIQIKGAIIEMCNKTDIQDYPVLETHSDSFYLDDDDEKKEISTKYELAS